jgi:hypothetical protein
VQFHPLPSMSGWMHSSPPTATLTFPEA